MLDLILYTLLFRLASVHCSSKLVIHIVMLFVVNCYLVNKYVSKSS